MPLQLRVIEGADTGHTFPLPESGAIRIGNSRKHAEIHLNDLYVARVHCQVEITKGKVVVAQADPGHDTFINGQKVRQHGLKEGEPLRVGNTHLRLEVAGAVEASTPPPAGDKRVVSHGKIPYLSAERMELLSGYTLGHFELGPVLGRGQCGVVFRA